MDKQAENNLNKLERMPQG